MATKTITITEDSYEMLSAHKTPQDSFSDVIKKHFKKESLLDLVGVLTSSEAENFRKHIKERRTASRKHIDNLSKRLR